MKFNDIQDPLQGKGMLPHSDIDILRKAACGKDGNTFKKLMRGETTEFKSDEEADRKLCDIIAYYTKDEKQIDRMFCDSKLHRPMWYKKFGNDTYGHIIIQWTLDNVTDQFDWDSEENSNSQDQLQEALSILKNGNPLKYILNTLHLDNTWDREVAIDLTYTCISSIIADGDGLHTHLGSESGLFKKSCVNAFMNQISPEWKVTTISNEFNIYTGDHVQPTIISGMIAVVDVHSSNKRVLDIARASITHWKEGVTIEIKKTNRSHYIYVPPRIAWIIIKVEGEDWTRLNQVQIQETAEYQANSISMLKNKYTGVVKRSVTREHQDVLVCREIWGILKSRTIAVDIPWANDVLFDNVDVQNVQRFFSYVQANAALHMEQRRTIGHTPDGIPVIEAILGDFEAAKSHYLALIKKGKPHHDLPKRERAVIDAILHLNPQNGLFTVQDVYRACGSMGINMGEQTIRRALEGRRTAPTKNVKNYNGYPGLISKCPYLELAEGQFIDNHQTGVLYSANLDGLRVWLEVGAQIHINPYYQGGGATTLATI